MYHQAPPASAKNITTGKSSCFMESSAPRTIRLRPEMFSGSNHSIPPRRRLVEASPNDSVLATSMIQRVAKLKERLKECSWRFEPYCSCCP